MKILAIALNTFREAVRDKILYSLIFFAFVMIAIGSVIDHITIGQSEKIIKDFGLASISLFGVLISIFVGIGLVFKEIDKRTIYTILGKPIYRSQFLLGKYFGMLITLAVEVILMTIGLFLFLALFSAKAVDWNLLKAVLLIYVELSLITSVAMLFSSFSTPFLSGFFTLAIFIIGHLTGDLKAFAAKLDAGGRFLSNILFYLLPNLEMFNIKGRIVHQQLVTWQEIFQRLGYALPYGIFLLTASILIFQKREFK